MKTEKYSQHEVEFNLYKVDLKLRETKANLKTIRDVSELEPIDPKIAHEHLGKNIDIYI